MKYTFKKKAKRGLIQVYHILGVDKFLMSCGYFDHKIHKAIDTFGKNSVLSSKELKSDIKRCYSKYLTTPEEYFLFGFDSNRNDAYRSSFLSDKVRIRTLISTTGEKKFVEELTDKYNFYCLTKMYFGRQVFVIGKNEDSTPQNFAEFISEHKSLFVKPLAASYGSGAHNLNITKDTDINLLYAKYINQGRWILEDRIVQTKEMAAWNSSSINTVRLPCFYTSGKFHVLNPFLRTGRKGAVVDNGGAGGIFACLDEETGLIITDGINESNKFYKSHPDSGIVFKGWQVPKWQELLVLAEQIFKECLPEHKYIGFDFALTENGWVLIEGNWGQFLGQYASRKGVKQLFMKYLKGVE